MRNVFNNSLHLTRYAKTYGAVGRAEYEARMFAEDLRRVLAAGEVAHRDEREGHLERLARAFFENLRRSEGCEHDGWGLDDKRPFGNGGVELDVLEICGVARVKNDEGQIEYALVLASEYDAAEREGNWELAHGYEPGYLAQARAEREAVARAAAGAAARGEEAPRETEAQRRRREERERRARDRRERRSELARHREWAQRDREAYRAGAEAGGAIGLDTQVKATADVGRLSGGAA